MRLSKTKRMKKFSGFIWWDEYGGITNITNCNSAVTYKTAPKRSGFLVFEKIDKIWKFFAKTPLQILKCVIECIMLQVKYYLFSI